MDQGYILIQSYGDGWLFWSKVKKQTYWRMAKEAVEILKYGIHQRDKKYWLREAYRCEKCGLIVFEEKYTLFDEEEKK